MNRRRLTGSHASDTAASVSLSPIMFLVLLSFGLMASSVLAVDSDYCNFTPKHTMCQYKVRISSRFDAFQI